MKNLLAKVLGTLGQGKSSPASRPFGFVATKAGQRLFKVTQIVDDKAVKAHVDDFKTEGEVLVGAVAKNGEYEYEIGGQPPAVQELYALATKTITLCTALVDFAKAPYTNARNEVEALRHMQTDEARKEAFLQQNGEAINREVADAEKPLIEIKAKTEEMRHARDKKEEAAEKRKKISKEKYGGFPPVARAIALWLYAIILVFILPTETMLNVGALDSIESDLQSWFVWPTALTITSMIALAAHFLGVFMGNKSHKGLIAICLATAVLMLGIVFFLRAHGIQSAFVLTFINLAACLLMSGLSYIRHKDELYFRADEACIKWQNVESRLQKEIDTIEKTATDSVSAIYDRWNASAMQAVKEDVEHLELEILRLERAEEAFDNYLATHVIEPVRAMHEDFVTRTRCNFIKARQKNGMPVPPIVQEDEVQDDETGGDTYSENGWDVDGKHTGFCSLLVAVLLLGFTACTQDVPPKHIDMVVIGDASIAVEDSASLPTSEQQLAFIFEGIGFNAYEDYLSVTRNHIRMRVTHIGETSFPPVQTIELEEGEPLWSMVKSKRRAVQKTFIEEASAAIEVHTKPKGLSSSRVFDCLCHVLPPLVNSDADRRTVLITSDLLEHSDVEDFYTLNGRMPDAFLTIKNRFETHCPALKEASFSGIDFTAVYLPDKMRDKSTRHARAFWAMYIRDKGGQIEFLPNLPDVKSTYAADY